MSISFGVPGVPPAFPNVRFPAFNTDPFENVSVPVRKLLPKPPTVTEFVTVIEILVLIFKVPALFNDPEAVPPICRVEQKEFTLTLTVNAPRIITSSSASGIPSPSEPETIAQTAPEFQLPEATVRKVAWPKDSESVEKSRRIPAVTERVTFLELRNGFLKIRLMGRVKSS